MKMKKISAFLLAGSMLFAGTGQAFAAHTEAEVTYGVNFRTAPNTSSTVMRMLPRGETIHVLDQVNRHWLKIETTDGSKGYISASSKYTNYEASPDYGTVVTTGYPWLRSAPDRENSTIYRSVPKGTELEVLGKPNDDYVKVRFNGQTGYISTSYIRYTNNDPDAPVSDKADAIIETAKSLIGRATYVYGKRDHKNLILDCSSFTQYVFGQHGIDMKWGTRFQKNMGTPVPKSELQKGDLVFFTLDPKGSRSIGHVGIYMDNGQFIHIIDHKDGDVNIRSLESGYWGDRYITARRIL